MPDLLSHFAGGYAALRWLSGRRDLVWVLTGTLLPDLNWIARRILAGPFGLDPVPLSLWLIPWHTPWAQLFVALAIGAFCARPLRVILLLQGAAWTHFLLDAAQTRYGNGMVFLYPFVLMETSWGWFWPEDAISHLLAWSGLALMVTLLVRGRPRGDPAVMAASAGAALRATEDAGPRKTGARSRPRRGRLVLALGCVAVIVASAAATRTALTRANVYMLGLVQKPAAYEGARVGIDRTQVVAERPPQVEPLDRGRLTLVGADDLRMGETVSVLGTFRDGTIVVEHLHRHQERWRSGYSLLGLALFGLVLLRRR